MVSRRTLLKAGGLGVVTLAGCGSNQRRETVTDDRQTTERAPLFQATDSCSAATDVGIDDPLALVENARGRLHCRGRPVAAFDGWQVYAGDSVLQRDSQADGGMALTMSAGESDTQCGLSRSFPEGVDLSGHDLSLGVRFETPVSDGITVQLFAPDADNRVESTRYGFEAGWLRLDHGPTNVVGDPDLRDVRRIRIGTFVGEGATAQFHLDGLRGLTKRDRGLVAFTFDDNAASQYEIAFPIMQEFGFPGAVAVIPHTVELGSKVGIDGLREMQSAGWDIVSHPQEPESLRELPDNRARTAIRSTKQWLLDNGFQRGAEFIIWPYGQYDRASLDFASQLHSMGFTTAQGVAGRITDPLVVPRVDGEQQAFAERMITYAERYNQLCVLEFHGIDNDDISTAQFRSLVERVATADVDVVSLSELWGRIR